MPYLCPENHPQLLLLYQCHSATRVTIANTTQCDNTYERYKGHLQVYEGVYAPWRTWRSASMSEDVLTPCFASEIRWLDLPYTFCMLGWWLHQWLPASHCAPCKRCLHLCLHLLQQDSFHLPPHGLLHQELIVDHRLESLPVKFLKVFITLQKTGLTLVEKTF